MARKTTPYRVKDFPKKPVVQLKKSVRWADDEPKNEQRVQMFKKCPKCILVPPKKTDDKADPENYKFPICTKLGKTKGGCQFNCKGVLAANRRARLTKKYPKVVALTNKLIETWQCTKKAEKQAVATQAKPKRKSVVMKPKRKVAQASKPKRKVVALKKKTTTTVKPKRKVVAKKKKTTTTMKPKKKPTVRKTTTTKAKKPVRKTTTSKSYGKPKRK